MINIFHRFLCIVICSIWTVKPLKNGNIFFEENSSFYNFYIKVYRNSLQTIQFPVFVDFSVKNYMDAMLLFWLKKFINYSQENFSVESP